MLALHLRELVLCAKTQPAFTSDILEAIRNRINTHPHEVNQQSLFGFTPIHLAVLHQLPMVFEVLLNEGQADLSISCKFKQMPELISKMVEQSQSKQTPARLPLLDHQLERAVKELILMTPHPQEIEHYQKVPKSSKQPLLKRIDDWEGDDQDLRASDIASELSGLSITEKEVGRAPQDNRELYLSQVMKAVNTNRVQFIEEYLEAGYSIDELSEFLGENIVKYCYDTDLKSLFFTFICRGGQFVSGFLSSKDIQKRHEILIIAQNRLLEQLDWQALQHNQVELARQHAYFNAVFSQQGRIPSVASGKVAKKNIASTDLSNDLYELSAGSLNEMNLDMFANIIAALASKYNVFELLATLKAMQIDFELPQKLISVFIVKEIIARYEPLSTKDLKFIFSVYLPSFFTENPFKAFVPLLEKFALLRMRGKEQQVNSYHALETVILQNVYQSTQTSFDALFRASKTSTSKQAKIVAEELRACSLRLYQDLKIKELVGFGWKNKNKHQTAPSVVAIESYFNLLSNYVVSKIVTIEDLVHRTRLIKLCIKIIDELIDSDIPDYNSAMSLYAALNQSSVLRLKSTFEKLDKATRNKYEEISRKLAHSGNYKEARRVLLANQYAIPYLGIVTADLTFSQENTAFNTYEVMGKVIRDVSQRVNALKTIHLPLNSNIARTIRYLTPMDESQLYQFSLKREPRVIEPSDSEPKQQVDNPSVVYQFERSRINLDASKQHDSVKINPEASRSLNNL